MRIHIVLSLTILSILFPLGVYAQNATVLGHVIDDKGKPIEKAVVSIGNKFDFTDIDGRYRIKEVPQGQQTIKIKKGDNKKEEMIEVKKITISTDIVLP